MIIILKRKRLGGGGLKVISLIVVNEKANFSKD